MKIKYSNKIKDKLPWDLLQECILLTYSVVPNVGVHIFHFEIKNNKFVIKHNVTRSNYALEVIHPTLFSIDIENLVIIKTTELIYVVTMDEFESLR